jgi:uncharacterized protein (DUF1800 family)
VAGRQTSIQTRSVSIGFEAGLRRGVAAVLCLLLPGQLTPALFAQAHPSKADAAKTSLDQRYLHLLSRFTFGATPDELATLQGLDSKHAVDEWFNQQLHPDRLPATAGDLLLATKLADFPALQLPVDALLERFPSGAMIRQAAGGKQPIPDDPYLFAIYRRHIDMYQEKQAKKAEAQKQPEIAKADAKKPEVMDSKAGKQDMASTDSAQGDPQGMNSTMQAGMPAAPSPVAKSVELPTAVKPGASKPAVDAARPSYADVLVKSVLALPPGDRVHRILFMQPVEYEQFHSGLKGPQKAQLTQDLTPEQRELLTDYENPTRTVIEELQAQRLLRDIYSSHQLQEVMTTFWLNHFNIFLHKNDETPYYLVSFERDVIRPRALGNFEDLLVATAESPAMLLYLDNSSSTGPESPVAERQKIREAQGKGKATPPGLNENYARELMELHTLGVDGGYTQKDVTEVAKVFTGWTVDHPQIGGGFKFDENRHEPGKKLVLGKKIKENGQKEGLEILHMLATSPATAHFISEELAVAFVSDTPPATLVNRMAETFLNKNGEIGAVLKTMIHSPEFWAPAAYQAKVKTPLEYVISAARSSGAEITNTQPLVNALNQMGMPLYACVPPTGYSDKADAWVSTGELVTRMNFALSLATNKFGGIKSQWTPAATQAASAADVELSLEARLVPGGVSEKTRAAVLDQAQSAQAVPVISSAQPSVQIFPKPVDTAQGKAKQQQEQTAQAAALEKQNAQIAGLLLGSPEFQRR